MDSLLIPSCETLEKLVMLLQVSGLGSLIFVRLRPNGRWTGRAKHAFLVSLVGLAITGALLGLEDSHFALVAGTTMTVLLIGMIASGGSIEMIASEHRMSHAESALV